MNREIKETAGRSDPIGGAALVGGLLHPLSYDTAIDPFSLKGYSKTHPYRMLWTIQSRLIERRARRQHKPFADFIDIARVPEVFSDRGETLRDTSVTANQMKLLTLALAQTHGLTGDVVEVGSFRGVTTAALASGTSRVVYAIDPFIGYGGAVEDLASFANRVSGISNIAHLRTTSGKASGSFSDGSLVFAFIDAVHDTSNSWFDFVAWSRKVCRGGFVAMHDVDDFPGVGWSCRLALMLAPRFTVWGYCPNLVVFRKEWDCANGSAPTRVREAR